MYVCVCGCVLMCGGFGLRGEDREWKNGHMEM